MKITDLKAATIGQNIIVRVCTDAGISGYGPVETSKGYLKPHILFYKPYILGEDPTLVERTISRIRRQGAFKPWGAAVSAIEIALWDIAGQAAGLPVHKLLGGKTRDRVRVYNGALREPLPGSSPEDYAANTAKMLARPEKFTIVKQAVGYHSRLPADMPDFSLNEVRPRVFHPNRGPVSERGLNHVVACIRAMKEVTGDAVGLALDCGPGFTVSDAIRLARAVEPYNVMWLEDLITGDYTPFVSPALYREVTTTTSTPIHTGEQIYLRQNFCELIESRAVSVIGPDPCDVGGIAELKWIAEYADLHGIQVAPHGIFDGLIGLAALVQMSAALPPNFIAFEYPIGNPAWWYDIVEGLPDPVVRDGFITVWDTPGLGVRFNVDKALAYLQPEDAGFFDDLPQ